MKKLLGFILVMALAVPLFAQTTQKIEYNNNDQYGANMKFYKADTTLSASSLFYYNTNDSVLVPRYITDADTIWSWVYQFKDINSIQYRTSDGKTIADTDSTKSFQILIQVANAGANYKTPFNMPDSLFRDYYWLNTTASDIDIVSTSKDSVDKYEMSEPFLIPHVGCEFFRVLIITNVTHTDTTDLELFLYQRNKR